MKHSAILAVMTGLSLFAGTAYADTIDVQLSPYSSSGSVLYNNQWNQAINGSSVAAAPTNGNQGGPTFAYWAGQFDGVGSGNTLNLTFSGLPTLGNASTVNSLMNTFYGSVGTLDAIVTFYNSAGSSESYDLLGGETIRDYYNNPSPFSNQLTGANVGATDPGVVTATEWWNNYADAGNPQGDPTVNGERLDEQTFYLPSDWAGTSITGMSIADNGNAGSGTQITFSALQIDDASTTPAGVTPEPSSFVLLGTGLMAAAGAVRRRFRRS